jgi:FkbM family methyltransferase
MDEFGEYQMSLASTMIGALVVNGIEDDYIFETIKKSGDFYEADLLKKWTPHFNNADCILDIGANIGNHSLYWSVNTKARKIYAFEPLPQNYEILCKNVAINHLHEKVLCFNCAVGERNGNVALESLDERNMGTARFAVSEAETDIKLVSIDAFCAQSGLPQVDLVKIDTEGFEVSVLRGMDSVITKFHPVIWIEAGSDTITDVLSIITLYGYAVFSVHASNLLFLHPDKHTDAKPLDINQVLPEFFNHVERRNQYYGLSLKLSDENSRVKKAYRESEQRIEEYRNSWQKSLDDNIKINENLKESEVRIQDLRARLDNSNALYRQSEERIAAFKRQVTELTQINEERLEKYAAVYGALSSTLVSFNQVKTLIYSMQLSISKYDKKILEYDKKIREHDVKAKEADKKILEYKKKIQGKNKKIAKANDRAANIEGLMYGSAMRAVKHIIYHHAKNFANRHRLVGRPMAFGYRVVKSIRKRLHR